MLRADPPPGYYDSAIGLSGSVLRQAVHDIIDDHQRFPYTSTATDTWDILELADEDPANTNNVLTLYKNESVTKSDHSQATGWNREHSWPSSYGFTDDGSCNYPYTDCHALFAADAGYNTARSNRLFDACTSGCTEYPVDGISTSSNWGSGSGNSGSWEVWNDRRGDVARAILYLAVRYEGGTHGGSGCSEPDLILTDDRGLVVSNTSSNYSPAYMGVLSTLLDWHLADPVDNRERIRNDVVFSFQGNRNPFVDHPEWVCDIWSCPGADTTPPAAPAGLTANPGDCSAILSWVDNTEPDLAGYNVYRSGSTGGSYTVINNGLLATSSFTDLTAENGITYYYVVTAVDTSNNESANSNEGSTTPNGSGTCSGGGGNAGPPWINEIHYDNSSSDTGEGVEIAGAAGTSLSGWQVVAYNGNGGTSYKTTSLSGVIPDQQGGLGTAWFAISGLQNGAPDGIALVDDTGTVIQFLSYEGSMTAVGGPADGMVSIDIGVAESSSTPVGHSLQLSGTGAAYEDFTWQSPASNTNDAPNNGQTLEAPGDTTPPAAPIGVAAAAGDSIVTLDWTDNGESDLAGYLVHRATTSGGPYTTLTGTPILTSAYSDTTVTNATTYYYVVSAIDTVGNESGDSAQVSATPIDGTAPNAPTGLIAGGGEGSVSLDWNDNVESDLASYEVYRSQTSGGPYTWITNVGVSNAVDATVTNGVTYYYVVAALDNTGNESADSNEAFATPNDVTAPAAPLALVATSGNGQVSLDWSDNTEADLASYNVYRATSAGGPYSLLSTETTSDSLDSSVSNGTTYYYVVTAIDDSGNESSDSNQASATPQEPISGNVWVNELHYDNSGSDSGEGVEIAGPAGVDLSGWTLLAYNGNGGGVYDTVALGGLLPDQENGFGTLWFAVSGLQNGAPDGIALVDSSNSIVEFLSYEGSFTATSGSASGLTSTDIGVNETSSTPVGHSLQLAGTGTDASEFTWQSATTNTNGQPNSNQSFGTLDSTPPAAPTGLAAAAISGSQVNLDWLDNGEGDLAGYDIYRSVTPGGPYNQVNSALVVASFYTDTGLAEATTYYYVVHAVDTSNNASSSSAEASASTPDATAPAAPNGLAAVPGDGQVDLDWLDNGEGDLAGYNVYRSTSPGGPYGLLNASVGGSDALDTTVANDTTYYYVVTALDTSANESPFSVEASATPSGPTGPVLRLEANTVNGIDATPTTVNLTNTYDSPVVIAAVNYDNNTQPVVVRVSNVTSTSFDVRLQSPGDVGSVSPDSVHYLVVEEGVWTLPDGRAIEAVRTNNTITDENNSWLGQLQSYGQSYSAPVVLGQVMTENDPEWSVFWCRGSSRNAPPSAATLRTGKTVCEDSLVTRANESIGYIVIEQGIGSLAGVPYEASLGADTVRAVTNGPPYNYSFNQSFAAAPTVAVVTQAAMDGNNGSWAYLFGAVPLTATQIRLAVDEDQVADSERNHTTEQVGFWVFESAIVYSD